MHICGSEDLVKTSVNWTRKQSKKTECANDWEWVKLRDSGYSVEKQAVLKANCEKKGWKKYDTNFPKDEDECYYWLHTRARATFSNATEDRDLLIPVRGIMLMVFDDTQRKST